MKKALATALCILLVLMVLPAIDSEEAEAYDAYSSGYWVGNVTSSDIVDKAAFGSYEEGFQEMMSRSSTSSSVASLFHGSTLINSRYAVLDLSVIGGADKTTALYSADPDNGNQWDSSTGRGYCNGYYYSESPLIPVGCEEDCVVTYVGGLLSRINQYQNNNLQYELIPISRQAPREYFIKSGSSIVHYYYAEIVGGVTGLSIGVAPDFFEEGVRYYSGDQHYFYTDFTTMINDYCAGTHKNAVNQTPWSNYYQFLPMQSTSSYTAADIDNYLREDFSTFAYAYNNTYPLADESVLYNVGSYFIAMEEKYGINPIMLLSISINESGWGRSYYAVDRYNIFGMSAFDSSTGSAKKYDCPYGSVLDAADWLAYAYLQIGYGAHYNGAYLGNKDGGINVSYASDPLWGEKAAHFYYMFDKYYGFRDYNKYAIALTSSRMVWLYSSPSSSARSKYNLQGFVTHPQYNSVLVIGEEGDFYKIVCEADDSTRISWSKDGFSGTFDLSKNVMYVRKSDVTLTNHTGGDYEAPENVVTDVLLDMESLSDRYVLEMGEDAVVYSDAYLTNPIAQVKKGSVMASDLRAYNAAGSYSYKVIYDLSTGQFGWVSASAGHNISGQTAVKDDSYELVNPAPVVNDAGETISYVQYNREIIAILETSGGKYQITADPQTGETGWVEAKYFSSPSSHTGTYTPENPDQPDTPESPDASETDALKPSVSEGGEPSENPDDSEYIDFSSMKSASNMFYLDSISSTSDGKAVLFRGLLAIQGMDNAPEDPLTFTLVLVNQNTSAEIQIPLERWTDSSEYPFDINAAYSSGYDFSGAWFQGTVDFKEVPSGDYWMYLYVNNGTYYSSQQISNSFSRSIVQRLVNSQGHGIELKTEYRLKGMPLELIVRENGLLSDAQKPTMDNAFVDYSILTLDSGTLRFKGTAFNVGGEYKTDAEIFRQVVLENIDTFRRYAYNAGSTSSGDYAIRLRVPDGLDKTRAWFDVTMDLTELDPGTYAIYVLTESDNGILDYGDLKDYFGRSSSSASLTYEGRTYTLRLNKQQRYRIELVITE